MGEREMSQNKSLQSKMPLAMGLAFVAFTTQFGGGFASGAQIYQYFINYGIWCLILPHYTSHKQTVPHQAHHKAVPHHRYKASLPASPPMPG